MKQDIFDLTYITIDSISEGVGSSQVVPLVNKLAQKDFKIRLITFEKVKPKNYLVDLLEKNKVEWRYLPFISGSGFQGIIRISNLIRNIGNTLLIHGRSDIATYAGIKSKQAPVLWDVRTFFPEVNYILYGKRKLVRNRFLDYIEKTAANNSSGVSFLAEAAIPIMTSKYKNLTSNMTVVPTFVDLERFRVSQLPKGALMGLFSGTYNKFYDLELSRMFVETLNRLQKVSVHWARPKESKTLSLNVGEVKVIDATYYEINSIIPQYHFGVGICGIEHGDTLKAAMPTKLAEFLACGRPIVINRGLGDFEELVSKYNIGVVIDGENTLHENANKLLELLSLKGIENRCREIAEKYFNIETGVEKYQNVYRNMLGH
jgi:hypothetical protein